VSKESAIEKVLRTGDQVLAVGGRDVSRMCARTVQDLLDQGPYGEPVSITIARKHTHGGDRLHEWKPTSAHERKIPTHERFFNKIREKIFGAPQTLDQPAIPTTQVLGQLSDGKTEIQVNFTREYISVSSVDASMLKLRSNPGTGVGLLRIREFSDGTYQQVCTALTDLRKQIHAHHNRSMEGVVIDLRGNAGGAVMPALDIAALFLPKDAVLMQMRANQRTETHRSTNRHPDLATALLVLVDGRTASASEILVEALVGNKRATSLGTRTVGKNVAQAIQAHSTFLFILVSNVFVTMLPQTGYHDAVRRERHFLYSAGEPVTQRKVNTLYSVHAACVFLSSL